MPQQREQPKLPQTPPPVRTGTQFNNPFTGPLFEPVTMESAGRAASSLNNLLNPFASAQRLAASAGGAMGTAARGLATGEIPLMGRSSGDRGVAAAIPQFPSGAMGAGYDAYPSGPQMPPATTPTKFPYGHPLGPSIYSQAPTATTLTTGMYSPVPLGQSFAGLNPAERSNYIPYGGGGTATMGLGGVNVNYPSRLGLMGGNIASGAISPLPVQTQQSLAAGLSPLAQPSMGIEGGPVSLRGSMAMTAPQTAEQRGLTPTSVSEGTVYATPQQLANLNARTTAFESRTPAQQQALLAQMRQRGAEIARGNITAQEKFFAQKTEERGRQPYSPTPTTIAGIQREFQQFRELGNRTPTQYAASRGIGGSVYSTTPFAQARGREAIAGFASGTAPRFSQQTLTAMRGGGPQPEESIAGLGLRSPFSNYG